MFCRYFIVKFYVEKDAKIEFYEFKRLAELKALCSFYQIHNLHCRNLWITIQGLKYYLKLFFFEV